MIVSKDALIFSERVFGRTDGILSLYNSVLHVEVEKTDSDLVRKNSIGGAATVWDAMVLEEITEGLETETFWDWRVCDSAYEKNIRLFVARCSRAQHIGIGGTNSQRFGDLEYGVGFAVETIEQAAAIAEAHEKLMLSQRRYVERVKPSRPARWRMSIVKRLPQKKEPPGLKPAAVLGVDRRKQLVRGLLNVAPGVGTGGTGWCRGRLVVGTDARKAAFGKAPNGRCG